jgi:caffeoyl-CoA O-methyltransferase
VVTLDIDEKNTAIARQFWAKSPHGKKIRLVLGPAAETIRSVEGLFDLVFIDADKVGYIQYVEAALERLSPNGVIVADNCLYSGEVLESEGASEFGQAIRRFNARIQSDPQLDVVLLPVRDGMYLIRKKT